MQQTIKSEFIFKWKIENFSHCSQKFKEFLDSPIFIRHPGETTKWYVRLYPKGLEQENMVSLFLWAIGDACKNVAVKLKFSVSATDGSILNETKDIDCNFLNRKSKTVTGLGFSHFALLNRIFQEKELFLPRDILTIICTITDEKNSDTFKEASARTRIQVQDITFEGCVENFSSLEIVDEKAISSTLPYSIGFPLYNLKMFFNRFSNEKTLVLLQVPESKTTVDVSCEIFLIDASQKLVKCGKYKKGDCIITLTLSREDLLRRKNDYLFNDILSLYFEVVYSDGSIEFNRIEEFSGLSYSMEPQNDVEQYKKANTEVYEIGLKEDLYSFFQKGLMCDKVLATPTKAFPVHSVVLSARSPIFREMFSSDLKKKKEETVPISEIDDDVLESLLLFIYKDIVNDLQWNSAFKLYEAANRYKIFLLKKQCALCLKKYLNVDNVCQILSLADLHTDQDLASVALNFLDMHKNEVMQSTGWEKLKSETPQLAIKSLCKLYIK